MAPERPLPAPLLLAKANRIGLEGLDEFRVHVMRGAQQQLSCLLVILVDGARIGAGELHGMRDDPGEHGLQV